MAIIAICVVVWVLEVLIAPLSSLLAYVPYLGLEQPWRYLTSIFAHSRLSISHIGFNMLTVFLFGRFLEPRLGSKNFLWVYLISGFGGNVAFTLLASSPTSLMRLFGVTWGTPVVGASGAIFGLLGAYAAMMRHVSKEAMTPILWLLGIQVAATLISPGIAWQAHVGGFIVGFITTSVLRRSLRSIRTHASVLGFLAVIAGLIALLAVKFFTAF